jgi:hypothetical protein
LFALIVIAVGIDAWKRDKRNSEGEQAVVAELRDTAVTMPVRNEVTMPVRNEVGERK